MTDLYYLSQTDGAGDWREREAKDLTEFVQRRIAYIQVIIQLVVKYIPFDFGYEAG